MSFYRVFKTGNNPASLNSATCIYIRSKLPNISFVNNLSFISKQGYFQLYTI